MALVPDGYDSEQSFQFVVVDQFESVAPVHLHVPFVCEFMDESGNTNDNKNGIITNFFMKLVVSEKYENITKEPIMMMNIIKLWDMLEQLNSSRNHWIYSLLYPPNV